MNETKFIMVEVEGDSSQLENYLFDRGYGHYVSESPEDMLKHFGFTLEPLQSRGPYPRLRKQLDIMNYSKTNTFRALRIVAQCLVDLAELSGGAALYADEEEK